MKLSWKVYIVALMVLLSSFAAAILLPIPDVYRGVISIPGVASLLGTLYQLFRDQTKYEKDIKLQNKQHIFNLSVTSHMANIAFDKHVEFCEKYIEKVNQIIQNIFENGPSKQTRPMIEELMSIRRQFSTWVLSETVKELRKLENSLIQVGIAFDEIEEGYNEVDMLNLIDKNLSQSLGATFDIGNLDNATIASKVVDHLQTVLGISELTALRRKYLDLAIQANSGKT